MATRAEIRLAAMGLIGDVEELTATHTTDQGSLKDTLNLAVEDGTLTGRIVVIVSGTALNVGQVRRVTANDGTAMTISFNAALPAVVAAGDTVHMYNYRSQGVTIAKVNRAINDALRMVREDYLIPYVQEVADSFDYTSPLIELHENMKAFAGVDVWETDHWEEVAIGDRNVDRWSRTVEIWGLPRELANTKTVRVRGYTYLPLFTDDTTDSIVDFEWVIQQTAANVLFELARRRMDPTVNERWAQFRQDLADERRSKVQLPSYGYVIPLYG